MKETRKSRLPKISNAWLTSHASHFHVSHITSVYNFSPQFIFILFLDNVEWIEPNPAQLCSHQKSIIYSLFSSKNSNKYEIDLNRASSAVLINLHFNATAAKKLKNECKITISTKNFHKHGGIYINILKMKLRQYRSSEKCIDTLQIKYNGNIKQAVCGTLQAGKIKSYEDLNGKVKLSLNIDTGVPFDRPEDFIELQVVATAFKECNEDLEKEFNCKNNNHKSCIAKSLVNDTIVNCIEPGCADESLLGCASSSVYVSDSLDESSGSENIVQIFLSAITSLILTMLTCGGLIWIIYKIRRCASPQSSQTPTSSSNRRRRRQRQNNQTAISTTISQDASPTAPPLDKDDLPPSYSELFGDTSARKQQENNPEIA